MSSIKTDAIVLRHANYGETNRMLTLLSPSMGVFSVAAKGSRKATSKTLAATELFTVGEYLLHCKGERYTLTSFQLQESYYPLRLDMEKLAHGAYWLGLCEASVQPGEECRRLFKMLLLSLAVLAYGDVPPRALTAVFLAQFSVLQGYAPRLDACARCGGGIAPPIRFDAALGGVCCARCAASGEPVSQDTLAWMQAVQSSLGAFVLAGQKPLPQAQEDDSIDSALALFRQHVEHRVEKNIAAGKFL